MPGPPILSRALFPVVLLAATAGCDERPTVKEIGAREASLHVDEVGVGGASHLQVTVRRAPPGCWKDKGEIKVSANGIAFERQREGGAMWGKGGGCAPIEWFLPRAKLPSADTLTVRLEDATGAITAEATRPFVERRVVVTPLRVRRGGEVSIEVRGDASDRLELHTLPRDHVDVTAKGHVRFQKAGEPFGTMTEGIFASATPSGRQAFKVRLPRELTPEKWEIQFEATIAPKSTCTGIAHCEVMEARHHAAQQRIDLDVMP